VSEDESDPSGIRLNVGCRRSNDRVWTHEPVRSGTWQCSAATQQATVPSPILLRLPPLRLPPPTQEIRAQLQSLRCTRNKSLFGHYFLRTILLRLGG
jgi:hypothetical protein